MMSFAHEKGMSYRTAHKIAVAMFGNVFAVVRSGPKWVVYKTEAEYKAAMKGL